MPDHLIDHNGFAGSCRRRRHKRPLGAAALVACAGAVLLGVAGCGGSGSGTSTAAAQRGMTITVQWPQASTRKVSGRIVPISTNSVVLQVTDSSGYTETATLAKSESTTASATFIGLRPGNIQVSATAYAGANGTGDIVDTVSNTSTFGAGVTSTVNLIFPDVPYASIEIVASASTIVPTGQTLSLEVVGFDANGNQISTTTSGNWSSSNNNAATVTSSGLVTTVHPGRTTITYTSGNLSATIGVISEGLVAVGLTPPGPVTIAKGATTTFATQGMETDGAVANPPPTGTWVSSNTAVATVDSTGKVTGVSPGTATIAFTDMIFGLTATTTVTVSGLVSVAISSPGDVTQVAVFGTLALSTSGINADGSTVTSPAGTWASSNTAAATVSSTGVVTGVAVGATTITFTDSTYGRTAKLTLTIVPAVVASVKITAAGSTTINQSQTVALTASTYDANGHLIQASPAGTWTTSGPTTATVSATGVVTGILPGTVTITFTDSASNVSGTISVVVQGGNSTVNIN